MSITEDVNIHHSYRQRVKGKWEQKKFILLYLKESPKGFKQISQVYVHRVLLSCGFLSHAYRYYISSMFEIYCCWHLIALNKISRFFVNRK